MATLPEPVSHTVEAIYKSYEDKEAANEHVSQGRLGMGSMGSECDRQIWYAFRWAVPPENFEGRKLRLFETGKREEERMIADLEAAGILVHPYDPETGEQWEVVGLNGHFVGKLDGIGSGFAEAPKAVHVLEFKTHNDRSFKDLQKKGVEQAKPGHFAQVQLYMHYTGHERAFYLAHNKNTDELYSERIAYDTQAAVLLIARAERIILADEPPPRLHENPESKAAWQCRYCPAIAACHFRAMPERTNCRTCLSSTPVDGGWHCNRMNQVNDVHMQKLGCSLHLYLPGLVPGMQCDMNEEANTVSYQLDSGEMFINGGTNV
jgi:hypothetical protein